MALIPVQVALADGTTTLKSSANPSFAGQTVTFTATVTFHCADGGQIRFQIDRGPEMYPTAQRTTTGTEVVVTATLTWTFRSPATHTVYMDWGTGIIGCMGSTSLIQRVVARPLRSNPTGPPSGPAQPSSSPTLPPLRPTAASTAPAVSPATPARVVSAVRMGNPQLPSPLPRSVVLALAGAASIAMYAWSRARRPR
jgi:hypothetical protein